MLFRLLFLLLCSTLSLGATASSPRWYMLKQEHNPELYRQKTSNRLFVCMPTADDTGPIYDEWLPVERRETTTQQPVPRAYLVYRHTAMEKPTDLERISYADAIPASPLAPAQGTVSHRNTLAAIAAVIAALTSWRAHKHRNLVVDANRRTPATEAALAKLSWYDRGSVQTARALQSLLHSLKKRFNREVTPLQKPAI